MTTKTITLPEHEVDTRNLFNAIDESLAHDHDRKTDVTMLRQVFTTMWYSSLTVEHINAIATAIHRRDGQGGMDLSKGLAFLVRKKVLRTRRNQGRKFYEVNY